MSKIQASSPCFSPITPMIRLGHQILGKSFRIFATERLRSQSHKRMRTAWPAMLIEFSDMVGMAPEPIAIAYTSAEVRHASSVCDIYAALPYDRLTKRIVLARARDNLSWKELALKYRVPWTECRRLCDLVLLHLVFEAGSDRHKLVALAVAQRMALRSHIREGRDLSTAATR